MYDTPVNTSFAQAGNWVAYFEGFPEIAFHLKNFFLPNVSVGMNELGGPGQYMVKVPGDRVVYDNISLEFFIQSDYANYISAYRWLKEQVTNPNQKTITCYLLDGQGRPQGITVEFYECFPANISPVMLDSDNTDSELSCQLDIYYESFDFI
ncbi:hypothetical protein [Ralstonia phage RSP15]|uniref:hypothetical protein n=1 Tax=Ralstonia phage RSP15 TaxID=1785960 RepID=UPI00074D4CE9|nr:hypothetical protein BH754_gp009 [Ralstonia phage RSP15]BAU39967.1 hypothetical protein [Ralstonia phage RSP15]